LLLQLCIKYFDEMFDAGNKGKRNGHGFHFVITCDEAGIFDAFYFVKDRLATFSLTLRKNEYYGII
jgi:hypothetical protein